MATRKQVLAPLGTVVAVVAVVAAVTVLTPGGGTHPPKVLQLGSGSPKEAMASGTAGGGYRLVGTLPTGTPTDAPLWSFDASPGARANRLASALKTTTSALRISHDPSQSWSFSPCAEDTSVTSSDGVTGCAVATPGTAVAPSAGSSPPNLRVDLVVKAAAPIFEALGLEAGQAVVETSPYGGTAVLDPTVSGLQTVGFQTSVSVDRTGTVQYASGWLGDPTKGDRYPLVPARQAFDALPTLIHPDLCRLPAPGEPAGCAAAPSQEITGAHLGLQMQPLKGGSQALLPAWLFDVKDSDYPVSQVAVDKKYLASDEPTTKASDQPVPLPVQVDPAPATVAVAIDGAARGTGPNEVVVRYINDGCPWQHVADDVKEEAGTVSVALWADPKPAGQVCSQIASSATVTVALEAPLGDRKVIDASTGKAVPLS
jgi:hypothetical protein